nr:pilus assembly protein TadG-related protein [Microcella alkalica]
MLGSRSTRRRSVPWRDEEGSILPLIAGFASLGLVVVLLVTAATSLYLERKRLLSLADGAALVGAESFALEDVERMEEGLRPRLTSDAVARDVVAYLREAPIGGLEGVQLERAATDDGTTAVVSLSSYWRPPVVTLLVPEGIRIDVTAEARSVLLP